MGYWAYCCSCGQGFSTPTLRDMAYRKIVCWNCVENNFEPERDDTFRSKILDKMEEMEACLNELASSRQAKTSADPTAFHLGVDLSSEPDRSVVCIDRTLLTDAFLQFLKRKYVLHADDRQRAMGLEYVTAEALDLAEETARFLSDTLNLCMVEAPSNDWMPISTAPRNGDQIELGGPSGYIAPNEWHVETGRWRKGTTRGWWVNDAGDAITQGWPEPTHWRRCRPNPLMVVRP